MTNQLLFFVVLLIVLSWLINSPLLGIANARTITTSTINSTTIRFHITASSWADMIDPQADCGTAPPLGSWGFITYRVSDGQQGYSTNQIYSKATLDVTEDFTLANETYVNGLIFGSTALNWDNLNNVTFCGTVGEKPFGYAGNGNGVFGTTTIPMTVVSNAIQYLMQVININW